MAYRKWLANRAALNLPIILLNASDDRVVLQHTRSVLDSMEATGFRNVTHMSYTGGHTIPLRQSIVALEQLFQSKT